MSISKISSLRPRTPEQLGYQLLEEVSKQDCDVKKALALIAAGAKLDRSDKFGRMPLLWAALWGHTAIVKEIIASGRGDLEKKDNADRTPLLEAAIEGRADSLKILIEAGAKLDEKDIHGRTGLIWAALNGREECLRMLIAAGALLEEEDDGGRTAIDHADKRGRVSIACLIREAIIKRTEAEELDKKNKQGDVFHQVLTSPVKVFRPIQFKPK